MEVVGPVIFRPGAAPTSVLRVARGWSRTSRGGSVSKYLLPGEHQLVCVRRHPAVPLGYLTLALLGLAVAALLLNSLALSSTGLVIIWLAWGVLFLYTVWKVASWFVGYLVVTPGRILVRGGACVSEAVVHAALSHHRPEGAAPTDRTRVRVRRPHRGVRFERPAATGRGPRPLPRRSLPYDVVGPRSARPIEDFTLAYLQGSCSLSPFRIVRLLEQALGNQATDSLPYLENYFTSTVADRLDKDQPLGQPPELRDSLAEYRIDLRRARQ